MSDELPEETAPRPRSRTMTPLSDLIAGMIPTASVEPRPPAPRVEQLEQLERELSALLASSAPTLWAQLRAPLRRLLNRARREFRALDRSQPLT